MLSSRIHEATSQSFEPRPGYDFVAPYYEQWHWGKFWRLNEAPIVQRWIESLDLGMGLDAGSGTGSYIPTIVSRGHSCVAADISGKMLRINKANENCRAKVNTIEYVQCSITALPFVTAQFDWVLCSRVLSHIADIRSVLLEFVRVLKQGGECLIADVHPNHPYEKMALPVDGTKILIETYKHSFPDFKRTISNIKALRLVSLDEYYFKDLLWQPPKDTFSKLYNVANPPIFYVTKLKKI